MMETVDESETSLSDGAAKTRALRRGKCVTYGIFKIVKGKTLKCVLTVIL